MTAIKDLLDTMDPGLSPESSATARAWIAARGGRFGAFVDGSFAAPGDDLVALADAFTGERLALVARALDVDAAVAAAARAAPVWSATPGFERARRLRALARLAEGRVTLLAVLNTLETGLPVRASRSEVALAIRHLYAAAVAADLDEASGRGPVGVGGIVLSCRSPLPALARAMAPALAAGNAVVMKPGARAPLSALAVAELCSEAGLPTGALNVVPGGDEAGAALARHPGIGALAFAGAAEAAHAVGRAAAGKAVSLDVEGAPLLLVFADADLDAAVEGVVDAAWSGTAFGARLLVQEGVAGRFATMLAHRMASLRAGDPLDRATDVGAAADRDRVEALVARAEGEGVPVHRASAAGRAAPPALLAGVEPASSAARSDLHGPVAALASFRTPAEAMVLAEGARRGPAVSVWSQDVDLALDAAARVRAEVVWVNGVGLGAGAPVPGVLDAWTKPAAAARSPVLIPARPDAAAGGRDVQAAVAAAVGARAWSAMSAEGRARTLHAVAEALSAQSGELAERLRAATGASAEEAAREVEAAGRRTSHAAAAAESFAACPPRAGTRLAALALHEPYGVIGIACPDATTPLLALATLLAPALAMGNRAVVVPSAAHPSVAVDLVRAFEHGGLPAGAAAVAGGERGATAEALAGHGDVAALWCAGPADEAVAAGRAAGLKPVWLIDGATRVWSDDAGMRETLRRAARVKTVWVPYGE